MTSALGEMCSRLDAIGQDIGANAQRLASIGRSLRGAATRAAAAARTDEGRGASSAAAALDAAARSCDRAAMLLGDARTEAEAYVRNTWNRSGDAVRGTAVDPGVMVSADGSSVRDVGAESGLVLDLRENFIAAHGFDGLDIRRFVASINPMWEGYRDPRERPPHGINCGLCAQAVAMAFDGRPHVASGVTHEVSIAEMRSWTGAAQQPTTPVGIEARLRSMDAGAHAIVGVDFADGGGHWFNAYYDGGDVLYVDGQSGVVSPWPPPFTDRCIAWDAVFTEGAIMDWQR